MNDNIVNPDDVLPMEYVKEQILAMEDAEKNGLYANLPLTEEQDYDLWRAMSTLSDLARETNSSLSDLLKRNGYEIN